MRSTPRSVAFVLTLAIALASVVPCARQSPDASYDPGPVAHAMHDAPPSLQPQRGRGDVRTTAELVASCPCGCSERPTVAGGSSGLAPTLPSGGLGLAAEAARAPIPAPALVAPRCPPRALDHVPRVG
jgi:hypothetical protein